MDCWIGRSGYMGKKVVKVSRNMILTEKMQMTNIIGNFVAFGREVQVLHPEELSLEIWAFTDFHQVS